MEIDKLKRVYRVATEIALVVYPDCQLAAIYGLTDLFRIAGQYAEMDHEYRDGIPFRVSHWKMSDEEMNCIFDTHPNQAHQINYVIIPPSIVEPSDMVSMRAVSQWMLEKHSNGATLASVCAGAFVLAETGLINNRSATTHWAFAASLKKRYPTIDVAEQNMVIDDGDIMTAGGILAWADLGLTIVGKVLGHGAMLATARFLLIDPPRQFQSTYQVFIPKFDHGDRAVLGAQQVMHANLAQVLSIRALAEQCGLTERTFLRRFLKATGFKPLDYLQQARTMKARSALETTNKTIDEIAYFVGYSDVTAFRKVFQKNTGILPTAYRQRFGLARDLVEIE